MDHRKKDSGLVKEKKCSRRKIYKKIFYYTAPTLVLKIMGFSISHFFLTFSKFSIFFLILDASLKKIYANFHEIFVIFRTIFFLIFPIYFRFLTFFGSVKIEDYYRRKIFVKKFHYTSAYKFLKSSIIIKSLTNFPMVKFFSLKILPKN